ncbi:MAG: putative peptidoglycan glycosyltransferase FtsW [Anaerolineales bacterium]|jgi:cell division protein FtsW
MGQESFLSRENQSGSINLISSKRSARLGIDVPLVLVTATLVVFGLLMVYSASWDFSFQVFGSSIYIFQRQLMALLLAIIGLVILTLIDYRFLKRIALWVMLLTVVALLAVLLFGESRHGSTRSLSGGSIQPSEVAKLITVVYLSVWSYAKREQLGDVSFGLIPLAAILGIIGGLILSQPDISAAATVFLLGGTLFFLAGADLRQIAFLVIAAILIGWLIVWINPTGNERMATYVPGLKDPMEASYHVRRSLEAFVNGGWFGVGIGHGITKLIGLPVPHSDSIFAVVAEETGFFGSSILVILYGLFLWRGMKIANNAADGFGKLLASGLSIWIAMEAFFNMAGMTGLLPFAGNALPFISAGGSNLVVSLASVGILFSISRISVKEQEEKERRSSGAVVDLRGWNRRRSLPRSRRSTKTDQR